MTADRILDLERQLRVKERELRILRELLASSVRVKGLVKGFLSRLRGAPRAGVEFTNDTYQRYIHRRLEHLATLGLPIPGHSVLELGSGTGELTSYFIDRGCHVTATEVRADALEHIKQRYPFIRVCRLDLDAPDPSLGRFDIVFCYGLLYHLARPAEALRYMAEHCSGFLLIETRVSYGDEDESYPQDEPADCHTQSAHGIGCRPTRAWVYNRLSEHFEFVYVPKTQPWREHYPLDWSDRPETERLSNAIFIGSRNILDSPMLLASLPDAQERQRG